MYDLESPYSILERKSIELVKLFKDGEDIETICNKVNDIYLVKIRITEGK